MNASASQLLDHIAVAMRARPPAGVSPAYLDGFLKRNRAGLLQVIEAQLRARQSAPPELWTAAKRTAANIAAMRIAASKTPQELTAADRSALATYSGWGGLSIDKVRGQLPAGFPAPETRGLIHEYYTPSAVTDEVARVLRPLLPELSGIGGKVHTLEPSAGIGRFVRSLSGPGFEKLDWHVVEWSELSARMLQALRPDLRVYNGPFERWVRERGDAMSGRLNLVVANPPYGQRGASITEDPARAYREKQAYAYFLRRALDLLAPQGLGVFLIPAGFLTGHSARSLALREAVLRRHHLAAAYRLPSGLFPGAQLVTDLLFFRSRGGELAEIDAGDRFVLEGRYFEEFPRHILGKEVGKDAGEDDQTKTPRWGYQVQGAFTKLPELVERKVCGVCEVRYDDAPKPAPAPAVGLGAEGRTKALAPEVAAAVALGLRVDAYLAAVASEDSRAPEHLWHELHEALTAWLDAHGNPWTHRGLRAQVKAGRTGAERFLAAFERTGRLIPGLRAQPVYQPRYGGRADDVLAQAELLYRSKRALSAADLLVFHKEQGGSLGSVDAVVEAMVDGGWAVDGERFDQLLPMADYLAGHLWPRYDRAAARARRGDGVAASQARKLLEVIQPAVFDDIEGVSPRQGWVPLDLVQGWLSETLNSRYGDVTLVRERGLLQVQGVDYDAIGDARHLAPEARWCIGWVNHDKTVFRPKTRRGEDLDEVRVRTARDWEVSFRAYIGSDDTRRTRLEDAYNRQIKGYVAPSYSSEPLAIGRWTKEGVRLHPHQVAGARRLLANRGGLLAFDVGVGKTYTGIAVLARARQEGWCRRPVIVVPNSIIWKWEADIRRVLPDYRVAVIGSKRTVIARGERKGLATSETDSPEERASKWTRFQAGEFDVVLLTYSAMPRTRMNEAAVRAYADKTEAIQREVKLRQRNAATSKKLTERQEAILKEGVAAWVAEMMELPESWQYDPGVAWDDIGVDLLIVDEAQNFKNLYLPEAREGGVPRFMGNAGTGSKRAWQLDFRTAAIRQHTGGSGVVLLSATPAKNSPLELYNLVQFIDHDAWSRMGIRDPEQFIDRYLRIELKPVVDTKMDVVERAAVTGFQNLHELRDVVFRYGEFKTAEDVGLKLPAPTVHMVEVDMNADQNVKYDRYVQQIEAAIESTRPADKAQILGLLARMALVAIHPKLDEGYTWKTAASPSVDAHSPKLDAMAERVAANRTCGHIVFVDNVAVHQWAKRVLVEAGVPEKRIAVLNATTAQAAADRQRIARAFNGDPETGEKPLYDVVIANAIAYEGIDLQTRTCAIHHLDLPWEPATLQQRNGRGVRQGNTLGAIEIDYYFARRSQDGLRFNLIQGKLGWMTQLLKSQARDTNNPGAQMAMGPEDILLLISRDPAKTAERLALVKARREEEARKRVASDAARLLRSVNARFRKAERSTDPAESARLRLEAEERLKDLAAVDPAAWPWAKWMYAVRDQPVLVPEDAAPVYEGLRVGVPSPWNPEQINFAELGRVNEATIGARQAGSARWVPQSLDQLAALKLEPAHLDPLWPSSDDAETDKAVAAHLASHLRHSGSWPTLGWTLASDAWLHLVWMRHGPQITDLMANASAWYAQQQKVPVVLDGALHVAGGAHLRGAVVLEPTLAGWRHFLELAPESGLKFGELADAATYWWDRAVPRDLLAAARRVA